ncbi:MAG: hypothetical protein ACYC2Y_00165 [Armatimonadota bacterium]
MKRMIIAIGVLLALAGTAVSAPIPAGKSAHTHKQWSEQVLKQRTRTMVEAYDSYGKHDPRWDADAKSFLAEMAKIYAYMPAEKLPNPDKLVSVCDDPLVLIYAGDVYVKHDKKNAYKAINMIMKGIKAFDETKYPKSTVIWAPMRLDWLQRHYSSHPEDRMSTEECRCITIKWMVESLKDGSYLPGEESIAAYSLVKFLDDGGFKKEVYQELHDAVQKAEGVDPYTANVVCGICNIKIAWEFRGDGWAYEVTDEGWKGFEQHLKLARQQLTKAWKSHPEYPEAARLMIRIAMADGRDNPRVWFDRAVAARLDYMEAYDSYIWNIYPRWGGSHEEMYAFGVECLKTKRFDTWVPWEFFVVLYDIRVDTAQLDDPAQKKSYWMKPESIKYLEEMFTGYENNRTGKDLYYMKSIHAGTLWYIGDYDGARRILDELGENVEPGVFRQYFEVPYDLMRKQIYAITSEEQEAPGNAVAK